MQITERFKPLSLLILVLRMVTGRFHVKQLIIIIITIIIIIFNNNIFNQGKPVS